MNTFSFSKLTLQLFILGFLIAFALGLNYLHAWTGPTVAAPNGNVDAPLNVGTINQVKLASLSVGKAAPTATDYGIISYGRLRSTIGGVEFPDGSVQTTAAAGGGLTAVRTYTSSDTWTKPAGLSYIVVEVWGGGAGGQNVNATNATAGGAGGTSSFGTFVSASGGAQGTSWVVGSAGVGSGGDINRTGGKGSPASMGTADVHMGGVGGTAPEGGAGGPGGYYTYPSGSVGVVPGGGGGGGGSAQFPGLGGSAGGYSLERISASALPATVSVAVGAGGAGGGTTGGAGAAGMVVVYEY